jgi:flagellar hook protein FlgE
MLPSMDDAVSGLQMHQQWMNVIGNNIANVSTPGFKASEVTFAQLFAQTLSAGSQPQAGLGGTNPVQIGLGVGLGSITQSQAQGALQQTGNPTDLALQGNGYFMLQSPSGPVYTRVGDFSFDANGNLVEGATGFRVLGWMANASGTLPAQNSSTLQSIVIPQTSTKAPQATSQAGFIGNLDSGTAAGSSVQVPFTVYDSLGNPWSLTMTFQPGGAAGTWNWTVSDPSGKAGLSGTTSGTVTFSTSGAYTASTGGPFSIAPAGAATSSITPGFAAMTQYASASTANPGTQNGYAGGSLTSLSVDKSGVITGTFSNGLTQTLGQVGVATFANPEGLVQQGQDVYTAGNNSGVPYITQPGSGGAGTVASGALEGSNVDLAQEFTNMIAAERGFQANAQVVTTSNSMLQTLVQMGA